MTPRSTKAKNLIFKFLEILRAFLRAMTSNQFPLLYFSQIYLRHAVVQLVEALRYNPEGRGFDS